MTRRRVRILDVPIDILQPENIMHTIDTAVATATPSVFAYTNIHTMNTVPGNTRLGEYLETADLNILDGKGVKLGAWLQGKQTGPALGITRLIWDILAHCEEKKFRVFLIGSTDDIVRDAARRISHRHPALTIAGCHHGYFGKTGDANSTVLKLIASAKPDVLLVGFGTPIQEHWVLENRTSLNVPITMVVGGCFDIIAGLRHAAPLWVAAIGLEWLHRLLQEPRRLWRRYLVGIPYFMGRIVIDRVRGASRIPSLPHESAADAIE